MSHLCVKIISWWQYFSVVQANLRPECWTLILCDTCLMSWAGVLSVISRRCQEGRINAVVQIVRWRWICFSGWIIITIISTAQDSIIWGVSEAGDAGLAPHILMASPHSLQLSITPPTPLYYHHLKLLTPAQLHHLLLHQTTLYHCYHLWCWPWYTCSIWLQLKMSIFHCLWLTWETQHSVNEMLFTSCLVLFRISFVRFILL